MAGLEQDTKLIRGIAEFSGLTPAAIARKIGVAKTTINRPYSGKATTRLSGPTLGKLKEHFPQFPGWTTDVELRMPYGKLATSKGVYGDQSDELVPIAMVALGEDLARELEHSAGPVSHAAVHLFPRAFIRQFSDAPESKLMMVHTLGDSMAPTIGEADLLLLDKSYSTIKANDQIWAVIVSGAVSINRIRVEDGKLMLLCDNANVPDRVSSVHDTKVIGRVTAIFKRA